MTGLELQTTEVQSIEEGHKLLAEIDKGIRTAVENMQADDDQWEKHSNEKYELVKARRHVQSQMNKIFKERRKAQKVSHD